MLNVSCSKCSERLDEAHRVSVLSRKKLWLGIKTNLRFVYASVSGAKLNFQVCIGVCVCFLLFMFFSAFWSLAVFNYLHTCHKIRWLLVEDNMKHDVVSAGPSMINILRWWFYPITFQSREACVGYNRKLLLISIIVFYWDSITPELRQTEPTK